MGFWDAKSRALPRRVTLKKEKSRAHHMEIGRGYNGRAGREGTWAMAEGEGSSNKGHLGKRRRQKWFVLIDAHSLYGKKSYLLEKRSQHDVRKESFDRLNTVNNREIRTGTKPFFPENVLMVWRGWHAEHGGVAASFGGGEYLRKKEKANGCGGGRGGKRGFGGYGLHSLPEEMDGAIEEVFPKK